MSNPQPPYGQPGQQPPAPWTPYPGAPAGGPQQGGYAPQSNYPQQGGYAPQSNYPQQGGYAPQSNYPTPQAYPPQQPGMYAPPSGFGQQPGYSPNPYAPYPTPPAPQAASQNHTAAGALGALGGIAALLGFFALPFYAVSVSYLGASQSESLKGTDFAKSTSSTTGTTASSGGGYPSLWIVVVAALVAIGIGAYLAFGMKGAAAARARSMAISLIVLGVVGAIELFYVFSDANSKINDAMKASGFTGSTPGLSFGFAAGFWICVLGMLAAIGGGVLMLRRAKS